MKVYFVTSSRAYECYVVVAKDKAEAMKLVADQRRPMPREEDFEEIDTSHAHVAAWAATG